MTRRSTFIAAACALVLLGIAQWVPASIPWSNPSGPASFFDWNSGQNDTGLFGSPALVGGNAFRFTPSSFRAEAQDGGTQTKSDIAEWNVVAHPGYAFTEVRIVERGSYGITGAGPGNLAQVNCYYKVSDNVTGAFLNDAQQGSWTQGSGSWTLNAAMDLSLLVPSEAKDLHVRIENNLLAVSGGVGNQVFIQKQLVGGIVDVLLIPEPTSLSILALSSLLLLRRSRR